MEKYTEKELTEIVKKYANIDGCTHYILKDCNGNYFQTCNSWINFQDINEHAKSIHATLIHIIEPK